MREGLRWHLIEYEPGLYDFSSVDTLVGAARDSGVELILDVLHFGWPDYLDIFSVEFLGAFERFTRALIAHFRWIGFAPVFFAPVNEASFLSWGGGDEAFVHPFATGRGHELKRQLVSATIRATKIIRQELPHARFVAPEPLVHIVGNPELQEHHAEAERYRTSQFEVWDMLAGRLHPELGGRPEYLDIIGVNFYERNEWVHESNVSLQRTDPLYRPFRYMLQEVWERYHRPIFVSETGTEDDGRPDWLLYICDEVLAALRAGVPVYGICLYPILNHPGWDDDRHCCNGLFDYADEHGHREIFEPLAEALLSQQKSGAFDAFARKPFHDEPSKRPDLFLSPALDVRLPTAPAPDEPVCSQ